MAGFVTGAPKNNLRLAISILGGSSKNIKTRVGLNNKLKNLYEQYCEATGHLADANNPLFVGGVRKSFRLYSTNLAAESLFTRDTFRIRTLVRVRTRNSEGWGNEHMVHETLAARSPSWRPDLVE